MHIEIRDLRYFVQVATDKSYTKAAEQLFISQPALSKAIHKLEDELSTKLLDVRDGGVFMTDCGEALFNRAVPMIFEFDNIPKEINAVHQLEVGSVTIGVSPMINELYLSDIILQFHHLYPNIEIHITESGSAHLHQLLNDRKIGLCVCIFGGEHQNIQDTELLSDTIVLCLSEDNPLCEKETISFQDIKDERFILYSKASVINNHILASCKNNGFVPKYCFSSSNIRSLMKMASCGMGVLVVPRPFAKSMQKQIPGLVLKPIMDYFPWTVLLRKNLTCYHSHAENAFEKLTIEYFERINKENQQD